MKKGLLALIAFGAALVLGLPVAFGGSSADPGITAKTIKLGGTFPLTGAAASYAPIPRGMAAYFSYRNATKVNGKKGAGGRQVIWKYYDDVYNPTTTVQKTQQLVESDQVFALVGGLGTEPQEAVVDYANSKKVPQIYVSTGATEWGAKHKDHPWTIGWQPDYQAEAAIYGRYIRDHIPNAKLAVLYQNDSYGQDYNAGLVGALGKAADEKIVATRTFNVTDPTVTTQLVALRASGADTLVIFATPSKTIQTYATISRLGWKPAHIILNSVSATQTFMGIAVSLAGAATVNGSISVYYTKDPANPIWANDAGMKLYFKIMAKYLPDANAKDGLYLYGMAKAYSAIKAIEGAGANPTRASLMKSVDHMNDATNPFLLPKVVVKTNAPKDNFPISQQALIQFNNGQWDPISGIIDTRPKG
jgi:branched-chain amino acid transport system substrate-binding protein